MRFIKKVTVTPEGVLVELGHPHTREHNNSSGPAARRVARVLCSVAGSGIVELPNATTLLFRGQQENCRMNSRQAVIETLQAASAWPVITLERWDVAMNGVPVYPSFENRQRRTMNVEAVLSTTQVFTHWDLERLHRSMQGRRFVVSGDGRLLLAVFHSTAKNDGQLEWELRKLVTTVRSALGEPLR